MSVLTQFKCIKIFNLVALFLSIVAFTLLIRNMLVSEVIIEKTLEYKYSKMKNKFLLMICILVVLFTACDTGNSDVRCSIIFDVSEFK